MAPGIDPMRRGGSSCWPRRLLLGTAALAFVPAGVLVYRELAGLDAASASELLIFLAIAASPGVVLAHLARPGEANSWRTIGVWITLLSYLAAMIGVALMAIGGTIWEARGGDPIIMNSTIQPGLVDSPAAGLFASGDILAMPAFVVFIPASLYTLMAFWRAPHREAVRWGDDVPEAAGGFVAAAVALAALGASLAAAYALFWHYAATPALPAWPDQQRLILFGAAVGVALALVAVGAALCLRGGRAARTGLALLWTGAAALTLAAVLDSFSATSLSGTTGTYAVSANGENGVLLNSWIGLGTFLLPAAVLALLVTIRATPIHVPGKPKLPWSS